MSILEQKLEEIESKIVKLVEKNIQYKQICQDLLSTRRKLEKHNKALNEMLDTIATEMEVVSANVQNIHNTLEHEEENSKEKIQNYIQDITNSINRLK